MNWVSAWACASAWPTGASSAAAVAAVNISCLISFMIFVSVLCVVNHCYRCYWYYLVRLVRERPQAQLLFSDLPQARQSVWFDDQEKDDQPAKHHQLNMRHGGVGERQMQQGGQRRQ